MKRIILITTLICASLLARAEELKWLTDAKKAQEQAKAEKKLVMLDFTGSDWCGWGIKLHNEVFSKSEFADYAKKNLVLVEVDFPRRKKLSAEQEKANFALQDKYKVEAYPTIIVLNGDGKQLGQLGYTSLKEFIAGLERMKKQAG